MKDMKHVQIIKGLHPQNEWDG